MKKSLMIAVKGLFMGAADIVPGVSGGTIAFITGIYDRLIESLSDVSVAGNYALRGKFTKAWKHIDIAFFLPLAIGLGIALGLGSLIIPHLIETWPAYVFSFFIGLILASAWIVHKHVKDHRLISYIWFVPGLALGLFVALSPQMAFTPTPLSVFFMGIISISAMLLPGISGSYILLVFGHYEYLLHGLRDLEWPILLAFKLGAIIGLLVFSRILKALLRAYHGQTFYALIGLMIGGLTGPAQVVIENADLSHVLGILILLVVGIFVVVVVEKIAHRKS